MSLGVLGTREYTGHQLQARVLCGRQAAGCAAALRRGACITCLASEHGARASCTSCWLAGLHWTSDTPAQRAPVSRSLVGQRAHGRAGGRRRRAPRRQLWRQFPKRRLKRVAPKEGRGGVRCGWRANGAAGDGWVAVVAQQLELGERRGRRCADLVGWELQGLSRWDGSLRTHARLTVATCAGALQACPTCKRTAPLMPCPLPLASMPLAVRSAICARLPMFGTLPDTLCGAAGPSSGSGKVSKLRGRTSQKPLSSRLECRHNTRRQHA